MWRFQREASALLSVPSLPACTPICKYKVCCLLRALLGSDTTKMSPLTAACKDCCCWLIYNCLRLACLAKERRKGSSLVRSAMTSQPSGSMLTVLCSHPVYHPAVQDTAFFWRGPLTTKVRGAKGKVSIQGTCQDVLGIFWGFSLNYEESACISTGAS